MTLDRIVRVLLDPISLGVAVYTLIVTGILAMVLPSDSLHSWGDIALGVMAALVVTFAVVYATRSVFWINKVGWIFLLNNVCLSVVMLHVAASAVATNDSVGDYPGREYVRLFIYAGGAIAYAVMLVVLLFMQRQDRRNHIPRGL